MTTTDKLVTLGQAHLYNLTKETLDLEHVNKLVISLQDKLMKLLFQRHSLEAHCKILNRKKAKLEERIESAKASAKEALDNSDEDTARLYAEEILSLNENVLFYDTNIDKFNGTLKNLKRSCLRLEMKISKIKRKRDIIFIRDNIANTELEIIDSGNKEMMVNDFSVDDIIDILEEEVDYKECKVEAIKEINSDLDSRLDSLSNDENIDALLKEMETANA